MPFKAELDAFRSEFMTNAAPETRDAMVHADMELAASSMARRALKAGDHAPDFRLRDARGGYVRLQDLLAVALKCLSERRIGDVVLGLIEFAQCEKVARRNQRFVEFLTTADLPIPGCLIALLGPPGQESFMMIADTWPGAVFNIKHGGVGFLAIWQ